MSDVLHVTQAQLEGVALAAARVACQEQEAKWTAILGINLNNVDSVEAFKANIRFAETLRLSSSNVGSKVAMATISGLVMAILLAAWSTIKSILHIPG